MMLRDIRWESGPRDVQRKGRFGTIVVRHSRAWLHNCLLCGVTERESLTILSLGCYQVLHKLISSWINMVTIEDMSILISASNMQCWF